MAKYLVTLLFAASKSVEVEADSEDTAVDRAYDEHCYASLCHSCAHEIDLGDCYDHSVEKLRG
jgi:hypothetical protein